MKRPTLLLAALAVPAHSATPAPLAPSTKWQMDYAPTECRLLRSFGTGRDQVTMQLGRITPDPAVELVMVGRRIPATPAPQPATLSTTTVPAVEARAQGFPAEGPYLPTLRFSPGGALRDAIASDVAADRPTRLTVGFARGYGAALDLGRMKAPMAALDTCTDDLARTWGLDPAEQRARRSAPVPLALPATWFRASDYPGALRFMGQGGLVVMRLTVGADGAVTGCAVAKAGGDKSFEDLTCRLATQRARFTPALGADGRPIASYWAQRVRWQPGA